MEETIAVDSSISLNHIYRAIKMISEIPFFSDKNARISRIETLPGGLTNFNFKVTVDNVTYALRIAGDGTAEFLNRPAEKHNASIMAEIGISAPIIYYNPVTGDQVCKYIDNCKTLHVPDFHDPENLRMAARIFRKYHTSGQEFLARFDPLKEKDNYEEILAKKNAERYNDLDRMLAKFEEIRTLFHEHPQPLVACHNDPLAENYLVNETGMYLIDWEYSGMNDAAFDLGDFSTENGLSKEEDAILLCEYFGGQVTRKQYGLVLMNKFVCNTLWCIWALLQMSNGKPKAEYWPWGHLRIDRCEAQMNDPEFDVYMQAIRDDSDEIVFSITQDAKVSVA